MRAEILQLSHCIGPSPVSDISPFLTRLFAAQKSTLPPGEGILCRCVQHIFDKYSVTGYWVICKNMGHRTYQLAVLDDW